jgi:hypothetical protein
MTRHTRPSSLPYLFLGKHPTATPGEIAEALSEGAGQFLPEIEFWPTYTNDFETQTYKTTLLLQCPGRFATYMHTRERAGEENVTLTQSHIPDDRTGLDEVRLKHLTAPRVSFPSVSGGPRPT